MAVVHVTSPTSRLSSRMILVAVMVPLMSSAVAGAAHTTSGNETSASRTNGSRTNRTHLMTSSSGHDVHTFDSATGSSSPRNRSCHCRPGSGESGYLSVWVLDGDNLLPDAAGVSRRIRGNVGPTLDQRGPERRPWFNRRRRWIVPQDGLVGRP